MRDWLGKVVGPEAQDLSRHDKWLCMMYPRLCLLREFLTRDGAIFVSIDDSEVATLRLLLDEVLGRNNFIATFVWEKRTTRENRRVFSFNHDFVLCYAREKASFEVTRGTLPLTDEVKGRFANPDNDPRGNWQSVSLNAQAGHATPSQFYTLVTPGGRQLDPPPGRCWLLTRERFEELVADNRVWFGSDGNNVPRRKVFYGELKQGLVPQTIWTAKECGTTDTATKALNSLFPGESAFNTSPKPVELVGRMIQIAAKPDTLILDSFAGSGTTGHAVLEANRADGRSRRFILVEMDETICRDVTAERLKRVIADGPGGEGFRYCTLAEPLFDARGRVRDSVTFGQLAAHVWFTETGTPLPTPAAGDTPLLSVQGGKAVYLLFNGVLRDKRPNGGNVLTAAVLASLPAHDGPRVVYGEGCRLGAARLARESIVFRQVPYGVRTD
jgi:site-specific DNA-methyltransferase (adenine-specific)/adenine-specific DNA-methyltransferase